MSSLEPNVSAAILSTAEKNPTVEQLLRARAIVMKGINDTKVSALLFNWKSLQANVYIFLADQVPPGKAADCVAPISSALMPPLIPEYFDKMLMGAALREVIAEDEAEAAAAAAQAAKGQTET